jgi:hypothetical protein
MPQLIVHRDGRKYEKVTQSALLPGALGNQQTLEVMSKIVREDSESPDLRRFVKRDLFIDTEQYEPAEQIKQIYEFCLNRIQYLDDFQGVERVADLWSCLYSLSEFVPVGDCVIKSVALATLLSFFDFKPFFIASKISEQSNSFNHVFCGLQQNAINLRLDATPQERQPPKMVSLYLHKIF